MPHIQSKALYLNVPFFIARAILYFAIGCLYSYLLSKWSAKQDRTGDDRLIRKMRSLSAPGNARDWGFHGRQASQFDD